MRTRTFNMIEVTLAIAVVAVGLVSVMALFPIGSALSRDMMAETYAAQAADQLLNVIAFQATNDGSTPWKTWIHDPSGTGTPNVSDTAPDPDPANEAGWANFDVASGTPPTWDSSKTIYQKVGNNHREYKIIRFQDADGDGEYDSDELLDFEAIAILWQDDVTVGTDDISRSVAATLNLELRWPAALPPERRQSAVYRLEVFNR
jgi:hypothetical protein